MTVKITRAQALMYLDEARALNNGGWIAHSLAAGTAAERMAARIGDMDRSVPSFSGCCTTLDADSARWG